VRRSALTFGGAEAVGHMKIVLRNPDAPDGRHVESLTVGSEYDVLGIECDNYRLLDDLGEPVRFDPGGFEVVDPQEPIFWVSEVGDQGERYDYPPGWRVPGFFEAWHDRDVVVQRLFVAQLTAWYPETAKARPTRR
jgi:hypothetical protein